MIFVDTSVWVAASRSSQGRESLHLSTLLDDGEVALAVPVRIEILAGASRADRRRLRPLLSALPVFYPTQGSWRRMESWLDRIQEAGQWFAVADLLIASIAVEQGSPVWSLDDDFGRMRRLGLIQLYQPSRPM